MSEIHLVSVQAANGSLNNITIEVATIESWKLVVSGLGFDRCVFEAVDLFEALIDLRIELEKNRLSPALRRWRVDTFPSGMSRDMAGGRKVYITQLGKVPTDHLDIFDETAPHLVGTVEQQQEFHDEWVRTRI